MSMPASLTTSLHDPVFWARYLFAHEGWPGSERLGDLADVIDEQDDLADEDCEGDDGSETELAVVFDAGGGHRLALELSPVLGYHSLGILSPGEVEAVELGWDDCAHWHPYALRWSELDLVAGLWQHAMRSCRIRGLRWRCCACSPPCSRTTMWTRPRPRWRPPSPRCARTSWTGCWPSGADWLDRSTSAASRCGGTATRPATGGRRRASTSVISTAPASPDRHRPGLPARTAPRAAGRSSGDHRGPLRLCCSGETAHYSLRFLQPALPSRLPSTRPPGERAAARPATSSGP